MDMSDEEFELLVRYRAAFLGKDDHCPVCGNIQWVSEGFCYLPQLDEVTKKPPSGPTMGFLPLVVLRCPQCQFVETFAWLPIVEWGEQNG